MNVQDNETVIFVLKQVDFVTTVFVPPPFYLNHEFIGFVIPEYQDAS